MLFNFPDPAELQSALRSSWWRLRPALPSVLLSVVILALSSCHQRDAGLANSQRLDFNQDVQPILASRCFSCHGPDPEMRKAGLRLDLAESAMKKRPGHPDAIVPGHPDDSELIKRIESKDPHHLMPQTAQGDAKPMRPEEIAVLREWVKEGAAYRPHWAFEVPVRPSLPASVADSWSRNPIDRFILARMTKDGLKPSQDADKSTLLRRVTLDLTGLLPTPQEAEAFLNDTSSTAYERLVDRLLNKPAFGEQRARYWLDYARYADTYGLHFDNSRDIWPYRDYVIRSFNSNKPFDRFAVEQIAGDLLPATNLDPLIGSGYVRLGVSSNEGGTIPEELRVNMARERTEAFGATFMGLTVGCAVCHDHKFDPTTQRDFYALSAFFANIDEKPFNDDRPVWAPALRIPKPQNEQAYNRLYARHSEIASQINRMRAHERERVTRWIASRQNLPQSISTDRLVLRLRLDESSGDVLHNSAPHAVNATYQTTGVKPEWGEQTWLWPDFRMQPSTRAMLGQTGNFDTSQAFSSGGWFMFRSAPNYPVSSASGTLLSKMDTTQHNRGWALTLRNGIVSIELINQSPHDDDRKGKSKQKAIEAKEPFHYPTPQNLSKQELDTPNKPKPKKESPKRNVERKPKLAPKSDPKPAEDNTPRAEIHVATTQPLPLDGEWKHIFFTYDGSGSAAGIHIFVNGSSVATTIVSNTLGAASILTSAPMQLGWKYPESSPSKETRYQDVRLYSRALTTEESAQLPFEDYVAELVAIPTSRWKDDQWHVAGEYYLQRLDSEFKAARAESSKLETQLDALSAGGVLTQVSWEKPSLPYAHVLARGVYSARTERVLADTPHYLPPLPSQETRNRLALAKWTVDRENPLTARVTVNRMWSELFGAGLVETTEDFGIMGHRPTHPELLDWLAVEFRESGWDIKHMYKLMVTSATYRQSGASTAAQLKRDPNNALLSHGPRFRMDAEMLRDIALQSGNLLVTGIGGPSVKTYQPPNVWEQVSYPTSDTLIYTQQHGDALYRRSLYTYWKRMASPPSMDAFDAPVRDVVCTRRQRTDTPLQALVTLNDEQWVEAARALAQRVIHQGGRSTPKRIGLMSQILLSHPASPKMEGVLETSLQEMEKHYNSDRNAAHALLTVGESKHDPSIPEPELAAWTMVASEMLNLDETLNK